jgi:hypothetical protein
MSETMRLLGLARRYQREHGVKPSAIAVPEVALRLVASEAILSAPGETPAGLGPSEIDQIVADLRENPDAPDGATLFGFRLVLDESLDADQVEIRP